MMAGLRLATPQAAARPSAVLERQCRMRRRDRPLSCRPRLASDVL